MYIFNLGQVKHLFSFGNSSHGTFNSNTIYKHISSISFNNVYKLTILVISNIMLRLFFDIVLSNPLKIYSFILQINDF